MRELFRIRDFRLLWTGQAISNFGDALTNLALLLTAQRLTGSTAAVATTAIAAALPTLAFGLFAGAYVDRWNRKRVMIVSDLFRSSFVLLFLLVTTADMMWLLYVVAFVQASLGTFFGPAKSAYLPRIVGSENLLAANSISQMTQIVLGLAGTAAAGLIAATADSLAPAFLIDAGSFFLSLLMIALIRTDADPRPAQAPQRPKILTEVKIGLSTIVGSPILKGVLVGAGVLMFGLGATNVLLVPFIVEVLAVPETWFAAIEASQVVSMVAASALVAVLARRVKPTSIITLGLAGIGVAVMTMSLAQVPWHLMLILFLVGWAISPLQASVSTLVQSEVPDEMRGRTGSALSTVITGANVASMGLAGGLAAWLGVRSVFVVSGAFALAASALTLVLFRGVTLRGEDSIEVEGDVEVRGTVGERADADDVHPRLGDAPDGLVVDPA